MQVPVIAAQVAASPPAGSAASSGTATVSLLLLCAVAAWVCVRQKGAQWPHIAIGVAIGVVGASTFIGSLTWSVLDILVKLLNQLSGAFGGPTVA